MDEFNVQDVLQEFGWDLTRDDLVFLTRLSDGRTPRKITDPPITRRQRDEWFLANENRDVWYVAQALLAKVYGEDPP